MRGGLHSYGYAVTMFANAARYREFWEQVSAGAKRGHLTPHGTYFAFQGNSGSRDWSGAYVRSDGTIGRFQGRHNYPLYCVGCGRADLRVAEQFACTEVICVPASLLIKIPLNPALPHELTQRRAEAAWRKKARFLEQLQAAKVVPTAAPGQDHVPPPRPQTVRQRPVRKPGAVEGLLLSVAGSLWGTLKFLLLIVLIGLAASRR